MTKKVVLLALALVLAAATTQAIAKASQMGKVPCPAECGKDMDNTECPNNLCCSSGGLCGLGSDYCGGGCQSGACQASAQCGADQPCPNNQCCNGEQCGLGSLYCGNGCQSGPCVQDLTCGQGKECPNNFCCNKAGKCGLGDRYCSNNTEVACQSGACYDDKITIDSMRCGTQNGGNGKTCLNKRCCSQYGYCGTETAYCGSSNCQQGYGTCSSDGQELALDAILGCKRPA